eukprot:TRINITY_DN602_c0_g2_i1.p1 TRINITY_DN602_c0_g2~~TRINITY_DN602_c0_g2_i1.p1  ORF type:complete len:309 (+),score=53.56 TRINITY_DN602_c0_g2_i1:114-929(+)
MKIKEYRIPLPFSLEEYRVAQPYMVARVSKEHSRSGNGVEIVANEPYTEEAGMGPAGQFTHKIFKIGDALPWYINWAIPSSFVIEEKAWNAYPYCKTVHSCTAFKYNFSISIETRYIEDQGTTENPFNLTPAELKEREVDVVDIAYDPVGVQELKGSPKYKPEEDPTLYMSEKSGRGKLQPDWVQTHKPIMCSYKLCKVNCETPKFQSWVEDYIHKHALRNVFFEGHRKVFCWLDEWFGWNMEDVRRYEAQTQAELNKIAGKSKEPDGADQ